MTKVINLKPYDPMTSDDYLCFLVDMVESFHNSTGKWPATIGELAEHDLAETDKRIQRCIQRCREESHSTNVRLSEAEQQPDAAALLAAAITIERYKTRLS